MLVNKKSKLDFIIITGPTATGKTKVAVDIAYQYNGEIISADSRQIYKGMDIGTGKDLNEYSINGIKISHHLIDILDPMKNYSVYDFQQDFYSAYRTIRNKNKIPILCGGTGLYIESTLLNYDLSTKPPPNKKLREKLEELDKEELLEVLASLSSSKKMEQMLLETKKQIIRNIEILKNNAIIFSIDIDREPLREKIKQRLIERIDAGMIEEVEQLINQGMPIDRLEYFGLEYKFIGKYLKSEITKENMIIDLTTSIRKFAKRQRTWFRRMEKRGININWIGPKDYKKLKAMVNQYIDES